MNTATAVAATGLTTAEARRILQEEGPNELPASDRRGALRIAGEVVRQPMFALLLGGGAVYLLLGDRAEALLLVLFATLSVSISIVQETRSEKVLDALRSLASPRALVVRDGKPVHVAGRDVVRGDRLILSEGDRVVADATLLAGQELLLDESMLTGESVPVRKRPLGREDPASRLQVPVPGGEDQPHVFAGTLVVRGTGQAIVRATGLSSEMGKVGKALHGIETEQPHLQKQLRWLIRDFAIAGALAGILVVLLYALLRGSWLNAMLGGIALGMSLIPEELPLVMTVFMAMGAWRISRARVLTRRSSAIETLGATTVLCTDKTGTLTENRMTVVALFSGDSGWDASAATVLAGPARDILAAALGASQQVPADPMDIAIHALARRELPDAFAAFSSRRCLRSYGLRPDLFAVANVLDGGAGPAQVFAKGAVESIAGLCALTAVARARLQDLVEARAARGIRVLAVAKASVSASPPAGLPDSLRGFALELVGLVGFADPIRPNVPAAVSECRSAGIRVIMITGDYPATAGAIAGQAGLDASKVISGPEIDAMSDAQLAASVRSSCVYARIQPTQKLRIVQSLKAAGEVVAMTGDGVNDAPAIKAAHIGIAMGGRGTDVAREAAAIVLLDDDFGSIVRTIRLGRRIYDNLRKAIEYIVAVHVPIAGLALLPLLLGLPLMLTPILIALLEMVIDPACSVVFEAEREEKDVMLRPPRKPDSPLLLPRRIGWAALQGCVALGILATTLILGARAGLPEDDLRALVFASTVLVNMGLILVNRSFTSSLAEAVLRPNRSLWVLCGGVAAVLAIALYWPPARAMLHLGRLHWDDMAACAAAGAASVMLLEWLKERWFRREAP